MAKKGVTGMLACVFMSLGLALGCVDPEEGGGGSVSGTSLYVFDASYDASDNTQCRILVYSDVAALFEDTAIQPARKMSGTIIERVRDLAWGGMCFDANGNRLYLVSETGTIVRIERARLQNGNIENQLDIVSFRLGTSSDRLSSGKFGQAFIDSRGANLYVTEANATDTQIWVVPATYPLNPSNRIQIDDDKGGTGVAATSDGAVYAYFDDGGNTTISGVTYAGPRLKRGTSSGFQRDSSMIIGQANNNRTELAKYGCLALDNSGNVFMARHLADAGIGSGNAVLMFTPGQFNPGLNQAPSASFANIGNLRVISHAVTKDWLVGSQSDSDYGRNIVMMWRSPSLGASVQANSFIVSPYASIRGLALDGRN